MDEVTDSQIKHSEAAGMGVITPIKIEQIAHMIDTQSRVALNLSAVEEYTERMAAGDKFPPIVVFQDKSIKDAPNYFLGDGFHRVGAGIKNGFKDILADVREGTKLDAIKYSIGANRANGVRRTNADKAYCVRLALEHFGSLSDRAIAEIVGVGNSMVSDMRRAQEADTCAIRTPATRTGRDGKEYPAPPPPENKSLATQPLSEDEFSNATTTPASATATAPVTEKTAPVIIESQAMIAAKALVAHQFNPYEIIEFLRWICTDLSSKESKRGAALEKFLKSGSASAVGKFKSSVVELLEKIRDISPSAAATA